MAQGKMADLTTGAKRLVEAAVAKRDEAKHSYMGINHWLLVLFERHGPMAELLLGNTDIPGMTRTLAGKLKQADLGAALDVQVVIDLSLESARSRGKTQATERDLAAAILKTAGYNLSEGSTPAASGEAATAAPAAGASRTPTLDQYGRDLTQAARDGKLSRIVGRQEETDLMMETLCRRTKRNPVLIGPAGVGKTAIVEGLANRVVDGSVPAMLKGVRIVSLQPSVLVAGTDIRGELEKRVQAVLHEAALAGVILFIDEIHTIVGAGGAAGTNDIGALLKPTLARGEIAVIAATTDDEYRRFIEADTALERRFQPIRVNEPSPEQTFQILTVLRDDLSKRYAVQVEDDVLVWLIQFGQNFMKNRYFPDKAVDLLEQAVAHCVAHGANALGLPDAQEVAQRMVGMPLSLETRLNSLQNQLQAQGLMQEDEITILLSRLQVTMRGLDLRSGRPNAVLLLAGAAAESSETLAGVIAGALFGDPERVVSIELSRMVHPEDISLLVGAPPGYVGYSDALPLHTLAQIPWSVVRFENIDLCHPSVRAVINQGIQDGRLTDGRGKPIYFSDTVVLLTADIILETQRPLGFQLKADVEGSAGADIFRSVAESIGEPLAEQVDLFLPGVRPMEISKEWLKDQLLADLSQRYLKQGLRLEWDATLVEWLAASRQQFQSAHDWERWVDYSLSPAIVEYLPKPGGPKVVAVTVKMAQDGLVIEPNESKLQEGNHGISK